MNEEYKQTHAVQIPVNGENEFRSQQYQGSLQKSLLAGQGRSLSSSHAEKRANHNAIERARRESLNLRFLELAGSIPALVHVRKPSKSVIVSRSIEYIQETKQRLEVKNRSLQLIRQQNDELKEEINRLRQEMGKGPIMFPDNIDLDLVFEANLEHQKEMDINQQQENRMQQQYSSSFRTGSPFDMNYDFDQDDDEDRRSNFGSMISPGLLEERGNSFSANIFPGPHVNMNANSLLGNALQGSKSKMSNSYQSPNSLNQYPIHANSMPAGSPLSAQPIQGQFISNNASIQSHNRNNYNSHIQSHPNSYNGSHLAGMAMNASGLVGQHQSHISNQFNQF